MRDKTMVLEERDKQRSTKHITQKTKDRATQTQLITEVGLCYSLMWKFPCNIIF
jgi:quinolinate synthase